MNRTADSQNSATTDMIYAVALEQSLKVHLQNRGAKVATGQLLTEIIRGDQTLEEPLDGQGKTLRVRKGAVARPSAVAGQVSARSPHHPDSQGRRQESHLWRRQ